MFLYTFHNNEYHKLVVSILPITTKMYPIWVLSESNQSAPLANFGDCLLCEDDLPVDEAHSIWESRCYK